ncbi:hypothetical protein SmJEL517_g05525 [Synchytrium microbalum]|uniref:Aldehyde dehydrogenase domain-containing protein n=1 Tax=Synchytrium microbalum TaxID=1806994 RepID=A0A507BU26_9FUNG|nr:uncharacterized protein SmJEL517_g05525 [Synchytrium microbalum]TPX31082.1 hypothetical protein SmJEL517_g05525 [Synchytrium microbalum]
MRRLTGLGNNIIYGRSYSTSSKFRPHYGMWINGQIHNDQDTSNRIKVESPHNEQLLTTIQQGLPKHVDLAAKAAQNAFKSWSKIESRDRAILLRNLASKLQSRIPELAELEALQTGRPFRELRTQLSRLPEWLDYFASLATVHEGRVVPMRGNNMLNYTRRLPLGVVGLITPFNHPLLIAVKKLSPALAAGNTIVIKPSELAPVSVLLFAEMAKEAGIPNGVINVVTGGKEVAMAMASHPAIRKIDLTGGTIAGRAIGELAGRNLAMLTLELGGKAPMIVFDDVAIDDVVRGAVFASMIASGQTCIMAARILVHERIYEEFKTQLVAKVQSLKVGPPLDPSTDIGPVISRQSLYKIQSILSSSIENGAILECGGNQLFDKGYYIQPTVLSLPPPLTADILSNPCWREELFGPCIVLVPFKDEAHAIELANDTEYGLAASVWSRDVGRVHRVAEQLDSGIVWVNDHHKNDPSSPFGGFKNSGYGRENGEEAFNSYTQIKSVVVNTNPSNTYPDWFDPSRSSVRYG